MSNSIITILNLACIKHTGCPLPSSLLGTDWKYIEDDCFQPRPTCPQRKRFAVWDPSPYSYPLKEVMPTDDPEHKILRNIVVDELKEIFNFEKTMLKAKTYLVGFRVFASLFVAYHCSQKIVNVLRGDEGFDALPIPIPRHEKIVEKIGHEELCEIRKVFTQNLDDLTGCFIKEKNFKKTFMFLFDIQHDQLHERFYTYVLNNDLRERLRNTNLLTLNNTDLEETIKYLGASSLCGVRGFDEYPITSIIKALGKYGFDIPSGLTDYRRGYAWDKFFKNRSVKRIEKKIRLSNWKLKQRNEYLSNDGQIKKTQKSYNAYYDCAINRHGRVNCFYPNNNPSPFRWDSWRFSTSRGKRAFDWLKLNSVQRPLYTEELVRIYAPNKVQDRKKIEDKVKNNFSANPPQPIYHRLN